jgi:Acyl-coenzyme A synthetases/AMP-(fatty) acid ligases
VDYVSIVRKFLELNSSPQEVKREKIPRLLTQLNQVNQEKFNWVEEVFEGIHVKEHGGDVALNWTNMDTGEEGKLTYAQLSKEADRVLSHLRKEGVREGDPVYLATPLIPEQWSSLLAIVKGGFVAVPTAVNLTTRELQYRFHDLRPKAVIADQETAVRLDEALGEIKAVKLVVGRREGWTSMHSLPEERGIRHQIGPTHPKLLHLRHHGDAQEGDTHCLQLPSR